MGRPSSIETHRQHSAIVSDLASGKPIAQIARTYEVSPDALSRYRLTRQIELREEIDDDLYSTASVIERMRALVEDARQLRNGVGFTTPAIRSRLIDSEARLLGQFKELLGIDAVTVSDQVASARQLGRAVGKFARQNPAEAELLVAQLRTDPDLTELADALSAEIQKAKN